MQPLVPDRACGACTACCNVLPIDAPDLRKTAGVLCRHCAPGQGCTIHARAPQVCRTAYCGWRRLARLDDGWRPDRSGLLLWFDDDDIPEGYALRPGVKVIVTGGVEALIARPALAYLAGLIAAGAPTFVSVPGPPGFHFAKAFLNRALAASVAARDGSAMIRVLADLYGRLARGPFEPVVFAAAPHDGEPPGG